MFKKIFTCITLICALFTLILLGNWQLQRLEWKQAILADIAKQQSIDPMNTPLDLSNEAEFQRGYIEGQFMQKRPIRVTPRTHDGVVGYHFIQPFQNIDGTIILVNMGWVSNDEEQVLFNTRPTKIAGYLKSPDKANAFTPKNNAENNQWYSIDINQIEDMLNAEDIHPQILYLESPKADVPMTFSGLPNPRNNHAQYAMFWFGMAGLLVILSGLVYFRNRK